jgi:hypothetical protein
MSYLYGDSTPSRLESNFIQFLSDALDVSVHLLLAGERMRRCSGRIAELKEGAEREVRLLEGLGEAVAHVVQVAPKGDLASATATCATTIGQEVAGLVRKQIAEVQAALATTVAAVEAEDELERVGCLKELETLLRAHDPPEATTTFHLVHSAGRYLCKRTTRTPYGLESVMSVEIAAPHPFSQVARVDKFVPQLEVSAPEMGGWLRKEVRNRPHRLEKLQITEMTFTPDGATLRLRSSLDDDATGFDVELGENGARVRLHRVGEQGDVIDPSETDSAKIVALHAKLRSFALSIPHDQGRLEEAKLDERPVTELREPSIIVDRLVGAMTPIVSEIARHSLAPTELVLKRLLGDNRREEIFVSKATLSEKLAPLPEPLRGRFKALGLGLNGAAARLPPVPTPPAALATAESAAEGAADVH